MFQHKLPTNCFSEICSHKTPAKTNLSHKHVEIFHEMAKLALAPTITQALYSRIDHLKGLRVRGVYIYYNSNQK